ncbi:unnamed protein product [Linum trigynum]|uniref:Gnk2-homologous domain-containing protein n=1 Tax=Linum trigynum TaxID=586398 RepID=A0AAV2GAW3_9ROSI
MMIMMRGSSSVKMVAAAMFIWLACSCSSSADQSSRWQAADTMTEVGVPKCNVHMIKDGSHIAGAFVNLIRKFVTATPDLIKHPGEKLCYRASDHDIWAYGAVSCFNDVSHCAACIQRALAALSASCSDKWGARVTMNNCFMRFESYKFCNKK